MTDLVTCPSCGIQTAQKARLCPKCGYHLQKPIPMSTVKDQPALYVAVALLFIAAALILLRLFL